jgi:hypothetical protein
MARLFRSFPGFLSLFKRLRAVYFSPANPTIFDYGSAALATMLEILDTGGANRKVIARWSNISQATIRTGLLVPGIDRN